MADRKIKAILSKTGNIDSDGDIIMPGAFDETLAKNPTLQMLQMHRRGHIIGKWSNLRMDGDLLKADGVLYAGKDDGYDMARMTARLIKENLMQGVSIGFRPLKWSSVQEEGRGRFNYGWDIEKLELLEASIVDAPANDAATVLEIKQKLDKHEGETSDIIVHKFFACDIVMDEESAVDAVKAAEEAKIVAAIRGI